MASIQPAINNSCGAILTIGLVVGKDRLAIVEPYGIDQPAPDLTHMCEDLLDSWGAAAITAFLACLSPDAQVVYLSAEGMQDGRVPSRNDYALGTNPGTLTGAAMPNNVTGLIAYYEDPVDVVVGERMRVGKTYMPGVPETQVTGDILSGTATGAYSAYAGIVINGFASTAYPANKWWRMLSTPKPRNVNTSIRRVVSAVPRAYVCTQRRRLIPR